MLTIPEDIFCPPTKGSSADLRILILTDDKVEDLEFFYPFYRFLEEGYRVDVATPNGGSFKSKNGYKIEKTKPLEAIDVQQYELLYIPGGKAPERLQKNDIALSIVQEFATLGKPIAALCHGPLLLAAAGVVKGVTLAAWPETYKDLQKAGARFVNQETMIDGNFITARWPADLPAHLRETLCVLNRLIATGPLKNACNRRNVQF